MRTISARAPDELESELEPSPGAETLDRRTAVRTLRSEAREWRREQALDRLAAGSITFSHAAELAGMSVWDCSRATRFPTPSTDTVHTGAKPGDADTSGDGENI